MRESLHLLTRKLILDIKRLFDVFRVNEALRELEVRLKVGFGVFHSFLVDFAGARCNDIGRLHNDVMEDATPEQIMVAISTAPNTTIS